MAVVEQPGTVESDVLPPVAKRRRKWPWVAAAAVVIILAGALTWALVWAAHYQPLVLGPTASGSPTTLSPVGSIMTRTDYLIGETGSQWVIDTPKPGYSFSFESSIANHGKYPITITNIWTDWGAFPDYSIQRVTEKAFVSNSRGDVARDPYSNTGAPYVPVANRLLKSGYATGVNVKMAIPRCATTPNQMTAYKLPAIDLAKLDHYNVTYKFLWFTHTIPMSLDTPIAMVNGPFCDSKDYKQVQRWQKEYGWPQN